MRKFEIIVVGAGTGGSTAAKTLALNGFNVGLIDTKKAESIGEKVCGDAIGKHHFDSLALAYPKYPELEREIAGIKVYSPDLKTVFRLTGEGLHGFIINRLLFGQRLLKEATDSGAVLLDSTQAVEPIFKDGFVKGVIARNNNTGEKIEFLGHVIVDASGVSAVLRSKIPPEFGIQNTVSQEDEVVCYREIRELRKQIEEPDYCQIYLDLQAAPGGYYWVFPEGENRVNVGIGVAGVKGFPNPKTQLYNEVLSSPLFTDSKVIHSGGGIVPTRRPLDTFVGNGIVIIGDAACQVNPIHGGGIGPSMVSGKLAGEQISKSLEHGETSCDSLWPINSRYMKFYGAKQAGLDVFRVFLQKIKNEDLSYGMKYRLFKEEDVLAAGMDGDIHLNVTDATRRVFRGLGRISFLKKLYSMAKTAKRIKNLYAEYPDSSQKLTEWKTEIEKSFAEFKRSL